VVDEAAQATEPHLMVAVASRCEALLLVGDPQQLPPTVLARPAAALGLGCSLMERLQRMGLPPLLLDTQYRMHPAICEPCPQHPPGWLPGPACSDCSDCN
jgi:superfamily I DNA and/or RNA helicase